MQVSATYQSATRFEVIARSHRLICDQPLNNGGEDQGPSPPEFLLASLATCAAYYAAQYLNTRGLSAEHLEVCVDAEKEANPARLARFRVDVTAPGLEDRHQVGLLRAVRTCLIHSTLLTSPTIEVAIYSPALVAA